MKLYLGQNEDYSLRGNISDSSEKLFQKGREEGQCICDFNEGGGHEISTYFSWTVACQAPLSMEFSGKNTGVSCHALLQQIFPTQG